MNATYRNTPSPLGGPLKQPVAYLGITIATNPNNCGFAAVICETAARAKAEARRNAKIEYPGRKYHPFAYPVGLVAGKLSIMGAAR